MELIAAVIVTVSAVVIISEVYTWRRPIKLPAETIASDEEVINTDETDGERRRVKGALGREFESLWPKRPREPLRRYVLENITTR